MRLALTPSLFFGFRNTFPGLSLPFFTLPSFSISPRSSRSSPTLFSRRKAGSGSHFLSMEMTTTTGQRQRGLRELYGWSEWHTAHWEIPQIVAQESRRRAARFEIALNARGKGREEGQSTARSSEARRLWARARQPCQFCHCSALGSFLSLRVQSGRARRTDGWTTAILHRTGWRRVQNISLRLYRHRELARGELANRSIIFAESSAMSGFLAIWEVNSLLRISYAEAHRFAGWPPAYVFPVS